MRLASQLLLARLVLVRKEAGDLLGILAILMVLNHVRWVLWILMEFGDPGTCSAATCWAWKQSAGLKRAKLPNPRETNKANQHPSSASVASGTPCEPLSGPENYVNIWPTLSNKSPTKTLFVHILFIFQVGKSAVKAIILHSFGGPGWGCLLPPGRQLERQGVCHLLQRWQSPLGRLHVEPCTL